MARKWTLEAIVLLLFALFIYAAGSKLADYKLFVFQMNAQPFNDRYTPALVVGLLLAEFAVAACLVFRKTLRIGLWASLALLFMFTIYIALIKLNFYDTVPCSCGGVIALLSWTQHLFFNLFFIAINIAGIILSSFSSQPQLRFS